MSLDQVDVIVIAVMGTVTFLGIVIVCWWATKRMEADYDRLRQACEPLLMESQNGRTSATAMSSFASATEGNAVPPTPPPLTPPFEVRMSNLALEIALRNEGRIKDGSGEEGGEEGGKGGGEEGGEGDEESDWWMTSVFTQEPMFCRSCGQPKPGAGSKLRFCTTCGTQDP